jgi:predicted NodU family carbamoyl transferase
MAPIMLRENLEYFFNKEQYEKTIGSDGFMILTYDYKIRYCDLYSGVMHKYPDEELYSGRPQVVDKDGSTVALVLDKVSGTAKALINTSYNIHGKPIVMTVEHAIDDFKYQLERSRELNLKKPYLLIGTYED